jgi:hypothetical protein
VRAGWSVALLTALVVGALAAVPEPAQERASGRAEVGEASTSTANATSSPVSNASPGVASIATVAPEVTSVSSSLETPARPTEVPVIALRIVQADPLPVTVGELYQALARSPWPQSLWTEVVRIAQCESRYGSGMDGAAEGDSGRALGVLQIRVDAHRELAQRYDLLTIDGSLAAAWEVYQRAGSSFAPWSCA